MAQFVVSLVVTATAYDAPLALLISEIGVGGKIVARHGSTLQPTR